MAMEKKLMVQEMKSIKHVPVDMPQTHEEIKAICDNAKMKKKFKQQAIMYGVDLLT